MSVLKTFAVVAVAIVTAVTAISILEFTDQVSIRARRGEQSSARAPTTPAPFPVRLVDSGGVGIPLEAWGHDYSHDARTFRDAVLVGPPYVDEAAFQRIEGEWHAYVERMLDYGNNGITVPLFLELIDFDRVRRTAAGVRGRTIYEPDSAFRARQAIVRDHFARLFEWASSRGMQVFLTTDMLTVSEPLAQYLRDLAPAGNRLGIDTARPDVWEVYRAGLEELFQQMPAVKGVVIRFGEGGSLYNTAGWPYRSEMAIRDAASLRAMLRGLLPAFETNDRTLVLRSWTVGIGNVGRLHVDPDVYEKVLGDIDSPALIVSTKFTAGDFFSYLPLNPTLFSGRHRRLVELQARPEFEGFAAFPNFLGEEHARALRVLRASNPHVVGTYLLTQFGGPLRASPRSLYPLHGFWLWTDANTFVASRLAVEPSTDVEQLARRWAGIRFGENPRLADAVADVLLRSREAVLRGFYIRPFAEREVRIARLELPPLMWIFEWNMVGGWHSLLSLVYQGSRDAVDPAIGEGYEAAALVRRGRSELQAALAPASRTSCASLCDDLLRSLEYEETLLDALAAWRDTFLNYYRWIDTGDQERWSRWQAARGRFEIAAARHSTRFNGDLAFPAFNLTSAVRAVSTAERAGWARLTAAGLVVGVVVLLVAGSPLGQRFDYIRRHSAAARIGPLAWTGAVMPWRLRSQAVDLWSSTAVTLLALVLIGVLIGTLTGLASAWMSAGASAVFATIAIVLQNPAGRSAWGQPGGRLLVAPMASLIPGSLVVLAVIAYLGPLGFWYWFWVVPAFRALIVTLMLAMLLWTAWMMVLAAGVHSSRGTVVGRSLVAVGGGIVALTLMLPRWDELLRLLDRPLNAAPATDTMIFALRTYVGLSDVGGTLRLFGVLLVVCGGVLWRQLWAVPAKK